VNRVSNNLLRALASGGLSRAEIARMADVPEAAVQRIIACQWDPPIAYGLALGQALRMTIDDLFYIDDTLGGGKKS